MYVPRGIDNKLLNNFIAELRRKGLWAERHSYSIRILFREKISASLHLYPGYNEAVLRLYSGDERIDKYICNTIRDLLKRFLPDYEITCSVLPQSFT
ncbi:MAG: hypothetical protein ABWW65_02795 [Thermoprotei archaeon]